MRNPLFNLLQKTYRAVGGHGLGSIKILRAAYDLLFSLFKPRQVKVRGHRMWLDDRDTLELGTHGVYEPMETALLEKELKEGQTFVDIGANIGYYTLIAAGRVGPGGKVYAFEPDPANFRLLQKNVETNGYTNVVLVNKAVSDKNGKLRLYLNPANRGDHRVYDSKDGRQSLEIGTVALDRFFKTLDRKIHFIKMDIQGAEASAFAGMKGLVRANKGLKLVTEFSPASLKLAGNDPAKYVRNLQKSGFRLFEISEKNSSVKPVTPAGLLNRPWGGTEDYTNLFCVKK